MRLLLEHRMLGEISPELPPIEVVGECFRLLQQAKSYGWVPSHRKFSVSIDAPKDPFGAGRMSASQEVFLWEGRLLDECMDALDSAVAEVVCVASAIAPRD